MWPFIEDCYFFKRKDNLLIAFKTTGEEIPVVSFKQKFIDVPILEGKGFKYMKKYMEMFPELWEPIEKEEKSQLTLFRI